MRNSKIYKFLVLIIVFVFLTGCQNKTDYKEEINITFAESINIDSLREYKNKNINITGFMAVSSPVDGSMAYVMNMPYQSCAYCVPNSDQLVNTIAVYPQKGKSLPFYETAITVTGKLVFKSITDASGYSYDYYLENAVVNEYQVPDGEDNYISSYNKLINKGFATLADKLLADIYYVTNYKEQGLEPYTIDNSSIDEMKSMIEDIDSEYISSASNVVNELDNLIININEAVNLNDLDLLSTYIDDGQSVYNLFYEWLISPQV